jgi:hypothetical protein
MRKINLIALFCFLFQMSFAQNTSKSGSTIQMVGESEIVKVFGLTVMQNYFQQNCTAVYSMLNDEVISFENGTKFNKSSFTAKDFCSVSPVKQGFDYASYLQNYQPEVLDYQQFLSRYPDFKTILPIAEGDYFFNGSAGRKGSTDYFQAADMTRFLVRKDTNGQWKIISM